MTDEDLKTERTSYTDSGNECSFNELLLLSLHLHCSFPSNLSFLSIPSLSPCHLQCPFLSLSPVTTEP